MRLFREGRSPTPWRITGRHRWERSARDSEGLTAHDDAQLPRPLIFDLIQRTGDVAGPSAPHLNLGLGMVLAVATDDADRTLEVLRTAGENPLHVGEVRAGGPGGCVLE